MKLLRPLLIGVAVLAMLLAVVLGLAFVPTVQTWVARRALTGRDIEVGRVSAGLHSVELRDVRVRQPGLALTLPSAEIELPLLSAAGKRVLIGKLVAKGWTLDLTASGSQPKPAQSPATPAAATAAVFQGIFQKLRLPVDLTVDSVELSGGVIFSAGPQQPPSRAQVTITGGGLAPGHEGKFNFQVDVASSGLSAAVHAVKLRGVVLAKLEPPRTFSHLGLVADGTAGGPAFPQGSSFHVAVDALGAAKGEHYAVALDVDGKPLLGLTADYPSGASQLNGDWQLNMHDTDIAPFVLGRARPAFAAAGEGRLETDSAFKTLHATGHLRLSAGRLELVEPRLRALGGLTVETDFDLTQNTAHTRVDRLTVQVAGARPVAEVRALQPFEFDSRTIELKVADPTKELLGFTLQGLPLAWIQPFLPGLAVAGNDVTGALLISARNGGFHFESSRPLEMRNFSVARAGHPLARLDQMAFIVTGDYTLQQGWQASLSARAQDGPRTLFTLQTKAGSIAGALPAIKATGRGQADLAALFAQPALASLGPLTGGSAQLDFQASFDEKKEVEAKFTVAGMTSLRVPSLPTLAGEVRAEQAADGQVTFNLPLTVENAGRKSDLALSGKFRPGAGGADIDVRLASNLMVVDDLKILAAPFAERSLPPTHVAGSRTLVPVPSAETRDAAPPWKGVTGRLTLALKKIVSGPFEMDDVAGELKIGSDAFALDPFRAVLGSGGEIKAASTVDFAEAAPEPYSLKAKVAASNVDSAPLFRALDPAQPPTVEGKFGLTSELASQGLTLAHLARRVQGEATLTSKSGIFRGLARSGGAQVLGPLSGPAGGLNRSSDFASVGRLTDALQQFPYDQINVQLIRDSSLNVQVKDFSVISQPLRVTGTGRLTYQKGVSLLNQSLALQIQLAARDDFATLFDALRKLSSEKDELGYTRVSRPIEIAGTPAHPDTDDLYAFLEEGGASRTLDRYLPKLLNLFGK